MIIGRSAVGHVEGSDVSVGVGVGVVGIVVACASGGVLLFCSVVIVVGIPVSLAMMLCPLLVVSSQFCIYFSV